MRQVYRHSQKREGEIMCGIIGYVGPSDAYPILLDGLGRLEYRGYDSAGVATIVNSGKLEVRRAKGKLENLRLRVADALLEGHSGMGHTRWATHGRPSEENAHPHRAGPVAVIHNGIVENFIELRTELLARGHKLRSETDTELISHLIEEKLKSGRGLTEAVREAVLRLRGSFSIVLMSETEPAKLVPANTPTPLLLAPGATADKRGGGPCDERRLPPLPAQGNQRSAAGVDRHDGGTGGRRFLGSALRKRSPSEWRTVVDRAHRDGRRRRVLDYLADRKIH